MNMSGVSVKEKTFSSYIADWADNTYIHGIPSVKRSNSPGRKFIWLLLFLVATGFLIQQCVELIVNYGSFPVDVKLVYSHERHMEFPAVTICNLNPIRNSSLSRINDPKVEKLLGSSMGTTHKQHHDQVKERHKLRKAFMKFWATRDTEQKRNDSHQLEDMLLDCEWQGQKCTYKNFTSFVDNHYGNCYTFNSGWDGSHPLKTERSGPLEGLSLEFFIEQEEYVKELSEAAGIKVIIHEQNIMTFPEDEGLYISPGSLSSIAIRKIEVTRLEYPYPSECTTLGLHNSAKSSVYSQIHNVSYSQEACLKTCYARHVIKDCACSDYNYPLHPHLEAYKDVLRNVTTAQHIQPCDTPEHHECWEDVKHKFKMSKLECECPIACNEVEFATQLSLAKWPSKAYMQVYHDDLSQKNERLKRIINSSSSAPQDDLLKLEVYYSALNYEHIQQQAAYPMSSLLSDIGGQLGFWIGLSMIACVEVLELLVDMAILACHSASRCGKMKAKTNKANPSPGAQQLTPNRDGAARQRNGSAKAFYITLL